MNEPTDIDTLIVEVERLDGEATPGPWEWAGSQRGIMAHDEMPETLDDPSHRGLFLKSVAGASSYPGQQGHLFISESDRDLIATFRTAAPALAAEVIRLRNAVTFADQQGAEAIERVSSAIIADKWNATAEFQERALKAEAERDELRLVLATERAGSDPWFVVHQRDGRPQLDVFSGECAEHAAKIRARDHAMNWSEVYIMRGVEVHGGDFEDEAMKDRADRG